jgi:hypothetical protein
MAEEKEPKPAEAKAKAPKPADAAAKTEDKPAAKKPPKKDAVEDKPFADFIQQDYLPGLQKAFVDRQIQDLQLTFTNNQVSGVWNDGQRKFTVYFPDTSIQGRKGFSEASNGVNASTIEPFLIDERKATLDLLVFGVIQRINAQKWFGKN